ncbi:MAG: HAMP domain-containing histidine kinase [Leptolinea sp.]|jgi:heavy metal sensor kinase|nr:HAMP domain-containing histidine kinase [Leptolinea sp.]
MSLRLRLSLLYTLVLGGVLLLFGSLAYSLVSVTLLDQTDTSLARNATDLIQQLRINTAGRFDARAVSSFKPDENIVYQVWGNDRELQLARPVGSVDPLDRAKLHTDRPVFNTTGDVGAHMRVLTIPLINARGPAGLLQIGRNLNLFDATLQTLAGVLVLLTVLSMVLTGVMTWFVNGQALAPLATVTKVATQITRADDLSRRIQISGVRDDEVGELIEAFNQVLGRLEKLFTSQRRFLADVSHELRTPLTVIKGNVGLMRKMKTLDEESLSGIETEVDRLTRLVGDLLFLAQAESGRMPMDRSPVEMDTVLLEVFQQARTLAGERISVTISEIDQIQVNGDRDRLKQVLLNIAGNAVQYTPPGGRVILSMRKAGDRAQITISDTGPGIPAVDLPHIFERFYRSEKSRKRSLHGGFGLGLSIAFWIVRNHGGTIDVASTEGKGTTFTVWLPLHK